ncbi:MAG: helix-hairpin-helix domain-containing protein [Trueperaceae bacterium]
MGPRAERATFLLALVACAALAIGAGWGRWRPTPLAVVADAPEIVVQVAGAVGRPGSYRLPWGSRVDDLISAAGGPTPDAALGLVGGAARLSDGATLVVPVLGDPAGDARVDVNAASVRLLETLPGVGPVMAARIVAGRPFHTVDDLGRVAGIGPVRLEALRGWVSVDGR